MNNRIPTATLLAFIVLAFLLPVGTQAAEETLDYLYAPQLNERQQYLFDRVVTHARNSEYEYALELSDNLLQQADALRQSSPATYGELMVNQGIILSASGEHENGLQYIDRGLEYMEQASNPFSRRLISAVMAKAITELNLDRLSPAEDSFRRAQHITHRQNGVYNADQLSMIHYLTTTMLKQHDPAAADTQQLFSLRVAENVYGPDSIELLPTLDRLGGYFATRGSAIPLMMPTDIRLERDALFKQSISMYQRSVGIIEQHFGENDLRLVQPLRGLASARMLQITNRKYAEAALERSLGIVNSNPQSDVTDRAQALIDLGDLYVIIADRRSSEVYLKAWQMLQETDETTSLSHNLFGTPTRLFPREDPMLYLDRQPDDVAPGDPLFVNLEYSVTPQGTVTQVRVVEKNVPNEQVRVLRQRIRSAKFRPRIQEGELMATEGLTLYQPFRVIRFSSSAQKIEESQGDAPDGNEDSVEPMPESAVADDELL